MKKILLLLLSMLSAGPTIAQQLTDKTRVTLVALHVVNLDSSVNWYVDHLNFKLQEQKEFKEYNLRMAFVKVGNFELELVENKNVLSKQKILNERSAPDVTGFAKLTFAVENIQGIYDRLVRERVSIVARMTESNRVAGQWHFIITDNDNNWIQFVGVK